MRIAVCIHGEPGTWDRCADSIRHFFDIGPEFEVDYFGHAWSRNHWIADTHSQSSYVQEDLNPDILHVAADKIFKFKNLLVESPDTLGEPNPDKEIQKPETSKFEIMSNQVNPTRWRYKSYSAMRVNFMKQQYELEQGRPYDVVVQVRWNQRFQSDYQFTHYLDLWERRDELCCEVFSSCVEFYQQSINDMFYFGSSGTMDLVESFYRVYHNGDIFRLLNSSYHDGAYKTVGYGVLLYKWLTIKNIYPHNFGKVKAVIIEKDHSV